LRLSPHLRHILSHPAARWGGALLAAFLALGQVLLLQHQVDHLGGQNNAHCDLCVAGNALDHAASAPVIPFPTAVAAAGTPIVAARPSRSLDNVPPKARGPPACLHA